MGLVSSQANHTVSSLQQDRLEKGSDGIEPDLFHSLKKKVKGPFEEVRSIH